MYSNKTEHTIFNINLVYDKAQFTLKARYTDYEVGYTDTVEYILGENYNEVDYLTNIGEWLLDKAKDALIDRKKSLRLINRTIEKEMDDGREEI